MKACIPPFISGKKCVRLYFEGLVQLTLGGPMHISHGGLQHGRVRYFDAVLKRPGLPQGISALVEKLTPDSVTVQLVNTSLFDKRELIIQAGVFGEHQFTSGEIIGRSGEVTGTVAVNGKWLHVDIAGGDGHYASSRHEAIREYADL